MTASGGGGDDDDEGGDASAAAEDDDDDDDDVAARNAASRRAGETAERAGRGGAEPRSAVSVAAAAVPRGAAQPDGTWAHTIGLVGYPNVGKSSTVNVRAAEKKTCVSATPGKTKHFQTWPCGCAAHRRLGPQ